MENYRNNEPSWPTVAERSTRSQRWPLYEWSELDEFLKSPSFRSGLHSINIGDSIDRPFFYEFYLQARLDAPLVAHFHGNAPRQANDLPIITGLGITEGLNCSLFIPSDPTLQLDPSLTLAWHAGIQGVDVASVTVKILETLAEVLNATKLIAWGGSGGGFAAIRVAHDIPGAVALAWNPQTNIKAYVQSFVDHYATVATLDPDGDGMGVLLANWNLATVEFWESFQGTVVYLQERSDWHVSSHLGPLIAAATYGRLSEFSRDDFNGLVSDKLWLFTSSWGNGHVPPPKRIIRNLLRTLMSSSFDWNLVGHRLDMLQSDIEASSVLDNELDYITDPPPAYNSNIDLHHDHVNLPFLTGDTLDASEDGGVNWNKVYETQVNSNLMWLYPLQPLGRLCASHKQGQPDAKQWATLIVKSFLEFSSIPENREIMQKTPSADHSASTRLKSLVVYLQMIRLDVDLNMELVAKIIAEVRYWGNWLSLDSNYKLNNHGLMGSIALLHAGRQLEPMSEAKSITQTAIDRIVKLGEFAFDKDGLCNENSIGYHNFNLHCYRQIKDFVAHYKIDDELEAFLGELVERASAALECAVWQDGSIPPLGDSPSYKLNIKSRNSPKLFAESGFAVIKNDELYISLICGGPTEIHKQSDDTSVTIRYRGSDVLIDAGSYLYDRTDAYRQCIESARGHSGIFPRSLDTTLREQIVRKHGPIRGVITNFHEDVDGIRVRCETSSADSLYSAVRRIFVRWPDEVVIVDTLVHDEGPGQPGAVQRFLFGPQQSVSRDSPGHFTFRDNEVDGNLYQLNQVTADLYHGEEGADARGWCSYKYGVKLPTTGLDFTSNTAITRFASILKLTPSAGLEECSAETLRFAAGVDPFFDDVAAISAK